MIQFFLALLVALRASFRARADAALEILALRQQLAVLKRKGPRPHLTAGDRLFWTLSSANTMFGLDSMISDGLADFVTRR